MTNKADREPFEKAYAEALEKVHATGCDTPDAFDAGWQAACDYKDKEIAELEDRLSLHNDLMGNGQCFTKEGWLAYEHKATALQADNARLREIFKKLKTITGVSTRADDFGQLARLISELADKATTPNEAKDK